MKSPSQALIKTFGEDRANNKKKRSLSPKEAIAEITALIASGWKPAELATVLSLSKQSKMFSYFEQLGKQQDNFCLDYLATTWKEQKSKTKLKNQLSLTTLGELALLTRKYGDTDFHQVVRLAAEKSFNKSDIIELRHILKLRNLTSLYEGVKTVAEERNLFASEDELEEQFSFLAVAKGYRFSDTQLLEAKKRSDSKLGIVNELSKIFQNGDFVGLEISPGKMTEDQISRVFSANELQAIIDDIRERG